MDPVAREDARLRLVAVAVRRHLVLVVAVILLVLAAAVGYSAQKPSRYTATATLLPRPATGNPLGPTTSASNGTQLTVAMQTEAGLVDTPTVSALASKALGRTVPAPRDVVTATVPPNTQIIRVTYTAASAVAAKQGAQAFALAFLDYRQNVAEAAQQETLDSLREQADTAAAALQRATHAAQHNSDPHSFAAQQVQLYSDRLATLNDSISQTESLGTNPGLVVSDASLPRAPNGLSAGVTLVGAGVFGLLLGVCLATWLEWRRDLVDSVAEYDVAGLPVLATMPAEDTRSRPLITDRDPDDALQEAYRRMRAGLLAVTEPPKIISVACVSAGSSARVAANLALSLAQAGFRVTLVAGDPGDHTMGTLLGARSSPGLADILSGRALLRDCVQSARGLTFIGTGAEPESSRELYAGPRLATLMKSMRRQVDYVIVGSAPTTNSDADALALVCDGVLLVVSDGATTHAETSASLDRLHQLNVEAIGAVSLPHQEHSRRAVRRAGVPEAEVAERTATAPAPPRTGPVKRPVTDAGSDV